jgi:hypothetical protein
MGCATVSDSQAPHEIGYQLIHFWGVFPEDVMTGVIKGMKFGPGYH